MLRVRALALHAQFHESEVFNPELALAGRFDLAFVLVYLVPLFLIALLYDQVSSERQAGRWLWRRAGLRASLVVACLAVPLLPGTWASGMSVSAAGLVLFLRASTESGTTRSSSW